MEAVPCSDCAAGATMSTDAGYDLAPGETLVPGSTTTEATGSSSDAVAEPAAEPAAAEADAEVPPPAPVPDASTDA